MKIIVLMAIVTAVSSPRCFFVLADKICAIRARDIDGNSAHLESTTDLHDKISFIKHSRIIQNQEIKFEPCNHYCYTLWQEDVNENGTKITIHYQGCWKQEGHECESNECKVSSRLSKARTKFCCCRQSYCNANFTFNNEFQQLLTSSPSYEYLDKINSQHLILIIATTLICVLFFTFMVIILLYRIYKANLVLRIGKPLPFNDNFNESTSLRTGTYTVDHLKLQTIIAKGKYGSVWQGSLGDQDVAVKIFPAHYQSYFKNEKNIYCLPFMEHNSLLHYYGSDERISMDGNTEYLLVLSYTPGGTLLDFLKQYTIDWLTFCKIGLSIIKGLAYLHTDIYRREKFKPCIAHRDINSKNILMKADGSCCLCDLGRAVQISGSKYYINGEEQHAETKSINDVGTLQYMAPEILEGAVNLRDCESSLKQIDVYAIGLVLWELVSRCSDIYVPGSNVPSHKLPYEKEVGVHPTFEQMQLLVSRNKARPLLEGNLVDKPGVKLIKETMEDCWDADAEARLTALCIEERLMELESHRIAMYFMDGSPLVNLHCGLVPSTTNSLFTDLRPNDGNQSCQTIEHGNEVIVVDNLVLLTPTENSTTEAFCKNSNETASNIMIQVLQPYQGRNLCMERNLMIQPDSSENLSCSGNILIDKSSKHVSMDSFKITSETQNLMPNDYLTQPPHAQIRPVTPIPFVQNAISENNGSSYHKLKQTNILDSYMQDKSKKRKFHGWTNLKKKILPNKESVPYSKCQMDQEDSKSNLLIKHQPTKIVETNVSLDTSGKCINGVIGNKTSASPSQNQNEKSNKIAQISHIKNENEIEHNLRPSTLELANKSKSSHSNLNRQQSLDKFNEIFNVGSNSSILKDPNMRIKTPGDLPPSVRKIRGRNNTSARFSLYDDRMMCNILDEEDGENRKVISNSVPYGIDFSDEMLQAKFDPKDVTCF